MPDGSNAKHRKLHCFINEHMASGNEYTVFDIPQGCRVGVLICYDNNIVENVRLTALQGAEVLLAPHQTGGCRSLSPRGMSPIDTQLWRNRHADPDAMKAACRGPNGRQWLLRWLPARAHDNGLFLVYSNGVGIDDDEVRTGNAMILNPYGEIIVETDKAEDDMVIADLDPSLRDMCTGIRWMAARRPELYGPLAQPTGRERDIRQARFAKSL
jgi:predicted amidohydrolase